MAEELIELGSRNDLFLKDRRPFLSGRPNGMAMYKMGFDIGKYGGWVSGAFGTAFGILGDAVNVPTGILSQGSDVVFKSLASALNTVPVLGELAAQVLLLANVIIKFVLSVPGMAANGIKNVFNGIAQFLNSKYSKAEQDEQKQKAGDKLLEKALNEGGAIFQKQISDVIGVKPSPGSAAAQGALPETMAVGTIISGVPDWAVAGGAIAAVILITVAVV